MAERTNNPDIRLVSRHWINHLPETLEDVSERWETVLKMCADPAKVLREIGLIVPVLPYVHEEDDFLDALGVDKTVLEHEGELLHEMIFRIKDADRKSKEVEIVEHLLRKSAVPQILIWLALRLVPLLPILQALPGWFSVGEEEDDFPSLDDIEDDNDEF